MERCPKCKRMSAERNHNTGILACQWSDCCYVEEHHPFKSLPYCQVYEVDPCSFCPECGYPYSQHRVAGMFERRTKKICPTDKKEKEPWTLGYWIKEGESYIWEEVPVQGDKIVIPTEKFDRIVKYSIVLFQGTKKKKG